MPPEMFTGSTSLCFRTSVDVPESLVHPRCVQRGGGPEARNLAVAFGRGTRGSTSGDCGRQPGRVSCLVVNEVTRILSAAGGGGPHAAEQLLPLVYDELRKLAAQRLAAEKPG